MIARTAARPLVGPQSPHVQPEWLHALWSLAQPGFAQSSAAQHPATSAQHPAAVAQHSSTVAKYAFQKVQMPTAAEVKLAWKTPPSEYGPEPYFGMNGAVTIQSLAHDLDTMKGLGFHAVTAQAGGGMTTTYLTPEYFAFFKQFALEAKKRDMKVWIVDDIGYPSGFAGGYFTKEKPELRMQALSIGQRLPVKGGETLNQAVGENAVSAVVVSASGERVAVPINNGNIAWTAPAGADWTVMVVEHVFRTSPTRSDANPTHAKDSSNSLEDYITRRRRRRIWSTRTRATTTRCRSCSAQRFWASAATSRTTPSRVCPGRRSSSIPSSRRRATTFVRTWARSCSRRAAAA